MKIRIIYLLCLLSLKTWVAASQDDNIATIEKAIEVINYQLDVTATEILKIQSADVIDFPRLETFLEQESSLRHEVRRFGAKLERLKQGIDQDTKMEPEDPRSTSATEFVNKSSTNLILAVIAKAEEVLLSRFLVPADDNLYINLSPNRRIEVLEIVEKHFQPLYFIEGPFPNQVITFNRENFNREERAPLQGTEIVSPISE